MFGPDQALGISEREEEFLLATMLEMEACRRNLVYFLERYAWTIDEHRRIDNERPLMHGAHFIDRDTLQPVRELDGSTDDYLRYAAAVWWNEDLTAYPKARQLRMTHLMVWCHGWLCMMYEGQRVAFQSKKFEDANETLMRLDKGLTVMKKMHRNMPWPDHRFKEGRILFPNGSVIMAVAQGADVVRQYTFSAIFSDETAFQNEADEAFTAALPTILGGGKYSMVSSAHPGFFQQIVYDKSGAVT